MATTDRRALRSVPATRAPARRKLAFHAFRGVCIPRRDTLVPARAAMVLRYYVKYYVWEVQNPSQEPELRLFCSKLEFS
eukprot:COSAG02_NODE_7035_length_3216_cov_5.385627_4_plen_78_part_01